MLKILWKTFVVAPVVLAVSLLMSAGAHADEKAVDLAQSTQESQILEQVTQYSNEGKRNNGVGQVTSVSQFSDVQTTDWAFQALQSLVERYGCIAGYPDTTFRGSRALTRYEFAAGLNACLDRINELIATATAGLVTKEDLETVKRLQDEFSAEIATLRARVDKLEAKTAQLEAQQFSTTTKLVGEAIFAVTDNFGKNDVNSTVFQDRVRLDFQSSFTGKDVLHTRVAAGNTTGLNVGDTFEGTQTFNLAPSIGGNSAIIDWLAYYFPLGGTQVYLAATGGIPSDFIPTVAPYFDDYTGGSGALSTFASSSPIYNIGGGAGLGLNIPLSKGGILPKSLTVGYLGSEPNSPAAGSGVFNGNYAAYAQANFKFGRGFDLAATYVNTYQGAGSALFDLGGAGSSGVVGTKQANEITTASTANTYGVAAALQAGKRLSINGFVTYSDIDPRVGTDKEVWSYGVGIALPDFGKKGNVLGLFAGAQPYDSKAANFETPYHVEGFYKYRVNDNVSITPGVIWLTAPGQVKGGDDAVIGTLRTTFTF